MNKVFHCKKKKSIIFKEPNIKSEHLKEILHGEEFVKIRKFKNFYYGYCKYDNYKGFIKKQDLIVKSQINNFLINSRKAYLYKKNKMNSKSEDFLYLNSQIHIHKLSKTFSKIKNKWIKNSDIKPLSKKINNNFLEKIHLFKDSKYTWGGNTVDGIDCSGLVQELMKNKLKKCPRDTKDQEKFFKKKINLNSIKRGDLLFWKGHVAIATDKKNCIHAYGPIKKVVKMKISYVISKLLKKSLKLSSIKRPSF